MVLLCQMRKQKKKGKKISQIIKNSTIFRFELMSNSFVRLKEYYACLSFTLSIDLASFLNVFKDSSKGNFEKE